MLKRVLQMVAIVVPISFILAVIEIFLEQDHGWATEFTGFMGKHLFENTWFAKFIEKKYLTPYHILVFCVILPIVLWLLFRWLPRQIFETSLSRRIFVVPWFVLAAAWLGIGVVEDFLWFVMNWYFPHSLRLLLAGQIWWHTKYWHIGSIHFPIFYLTSSIFALALALVQGYVIDPREIKKHIPAGRLSR